VRFAPFVCDTKLTTFLPGLEAYSLMYDTACQVDPATNSYCYIEAAQNQNPSDMYLYQLPINIAFPDSATPTCSPCSKDILNTYLGALNNSTQAGDLLALAATYNSGANAADTQCGSTFATASTSGAAPRTWLPSSFASWTLISLVPIRLLLL
jgi:hypothetical protein